MRRLLHVLFFSCSLAAIASEPAVPMLVVCAPGYPGNTAEAQPNLDTFAATAAAAAGWPAGGLRAVYHETEATGLARLAAPDASFALVPLPFYLKHRESLKLVPRLVTVASGREQEEVWTLVAKKGRLGKPEQLEGWEIASLAAYAPDFVKRTALGGWGRVPEATRLVQTGQVLTQLRRAARGEPVAVLLDATQSAALPTLPFAAELETVARSPALPAAVLCSVEGRLERGQRDSLVDGLVRLAGNPEGRAALEALRVARFVPADPATLAALK